MTDLWYSTRVRRPGDVISNHSFCLLLKCPDQVQQCFVELLRHIISHWLIRRPARFGCTCQLAELLNYLRIEGCTLVTMEFLRKPIVHEEMFKQNSGSSSCRLIARRYCLRILSEVVYDHLYIFVAKLGRFYLQIIHNTSSIGALDCYLS